MKRVVFSLVVCLTVSCDSSSDGSSTSMMAVGGSMEGTAPQSNGGTYVSDSFVSDTAGQENTNATAPSAGRLADSAMDVDPVDMSETGGMHSPMAPNEAVGGQNGEPVNDIVPDGPACDPRLRAQACEPGWFCYPLPNGGGYQGRCQQGDGCTIGSNEGCSDDKPYCHLQGGATFCVAQGTLKLGQDCVSQDGIPEACEDGLVCNYSVCQSPCQPGGEITQCPDNGRCAPILQTTGSEGGLCGPRNCNWFTGDLCEAGQKCNYAIRQDGSLVGSCSDLDGQGLGHEERCENLPTGGDNCAQGLACIAPPNGVGVCRILCDTGGYEQSCPPNYTCSEQLVTRQGAVRGYGLCKLNR